MRATTQRAEIEALFHQLVQAHADLNAAASVAAWLAGREGPMQIGCVTSL
jgi:hypothetical protein